MGVHVPRASAATTACRALWASGCVAEDLSPRRVRYPPRRHPRRHRARLREPRPESGPGRSRSRRWCNSTAGGAAAPEVSLSPTRTDRECPEAAAQGASPGRRMASSTAGRRRHGRSPAASRCLTSRGLAPLATNSASRRAQAPVKGPAKSVPLEWPPPSMQRRTTGRHSDWEGSGPSPWRLTRSECR